MMTDNLPAEININYIFKLIMFWLIHFNSFFRRAGSEENFIVHRGKGIPTLSSVADDKSARTEAAGRPSNWEEQRRSSYAGRRSRRNSITDDSQLTIENFGGSQVCGGERPHCAFYHHISQRTSTMYAGGIVSRDDIWSSDFFYPG